MFEQTKKLNSMRNDVSFFHAFDDSVRTAFIQEVSLADDSLEAKVRACPKLQHGVLDETTSAAD